MNNRHQVIWKFPFKVANSVVLSMPAGAKILHVGASNELDRGDLCVWALVWPNNKPLSRRLHVYGTGHPVKLAEQDNRYLGTVHLGVFVWHVFDGGEAL